MMKKLLLILFLGIVFSSLTIAVEEIKGDETVSKLRSENALESALEKTHQVSSARMQRVLEHELKFEPKIVGGRETAMGEYPWAIALSYYDTNGQLKSFCGGSLIGAKWVLTAAHCEVYTTDLAVIGRHDLATNQGQAYRVNRFIPHPSYDSKTSDNDIALVELHDEVQNTPTVELNINGPIVSEGIDVTVIGWGRLTEGGVTSNTLQKVTIPTVANAKCKISYPNLTDNMLCAGENQGGKDSCQGDSGGPLLRKNGNSWTQVGIVSFGRGCARPKLYGVYTRVAKYGDWINRNMH